MEKAGLLQRLPDAQDVRVTRVFLTDAGRETDLAVEAIHCRIADECFAGFTEEERLQMAAFLGRMRDNMQSAEALDKSEP
jgi:DNA-binding MarR family transcriptional regulator